MAEEHDHDEHEHQHEHEAPDMSEWMATSNKTTCPACGASGAVMLGGGIFCPTCGEVTTNPGYQPPSH